MYGTDDCTIPSKNYPETFPIAFSHAEFPISGEIADALGTPLGFILTPYLPISDKSHLARNLPRLSTSGHYIARCVKCAAYINPFCDASNMRWLCSLCGYRNTFTRSMVRYRQIDLRLLPEMQSLVIDYPLPMSDEPVDKLGEMNIRGENVCDMMLPAHMKPFVHVFAIQDNMPIDCLNAVMDALLHAVETMHDDLEVVLITYSSKISVYRFHSSGVCVQHVHFTAGGVAATSRNANTFSTCVPLFSLGEFLEFARPLHACRTMLRDVISSLNEGPASDQQSATTAIGPTLEALVTWILRVTHESSNNTSVELPFSPFFDYFSGFGSSPSRHESKKSLATSAELCSGIVLQLFVSSSAGDDESICCALDGVKLCANGIGCNIWSVVDFENQISPTRVLYPFAAATGGQVYKFVLGSTPALERSRLTLQLARTLGSTMATKTLLKIRMSTFMEQKLNLTGHASPDSELPGIYRMAVCSPELAVGCCLEYKQALNEHDNNPSGNFVLQVAFSFNAMVENDDELIDESCHDNQDKGDSVSADSTVQYISTFLGTVDSAFSCKNVSSTCHKKQIKTLSKLSRNRFDNRCRSKSRLVAVRRLRVISVMIECTAKIPRIIRCINPSVVVMLLMRQVIKTDTSDPKSLCEPFHRWCQAFVLAVAKSRVKLCDFSAKNLVRIQEIVADAVKSEEVSSVLRYMFSCMQYISKLDDSRVNAEGHIEMKSLVLTSDSFDAVKLFYPDQYAFYIIDGKLACKLLPLRREALMTSNPRLVILDNAIELIVYRGLNAWNYQDTHYDSILLEKTFDLCVAKVEVSHTVPRLLFSEAGKFSSSYFTDMLIEDASGGFVNFRQLIEKEASKVWFNKDIQY